MSISSRPESLLYYVLTGEEPFTGEASSVMHKLVSEPHPPLSERLSGYPTALDQILDRALAKYPEDRYSTAQEFAADLAAVIDELNRGRIAGLLEECKRLIDESSFRVAAEKAQQILKIDPQNSVARGLRRDAQRGLDRKAVEERLRELQVEAAEAVAEKRYDDAIRALEEGSRRAPGDAGFQEQLEGVREKRRLQLLKDSLCSEARTAQSSGDLTGAIQRLRKAVEFDPNDVPLLEELSALERVVRDQQERDRADRLITNAKQELSAQRYTGAIEILEDLLQTRVSHPDLDGLYRRALDGRKNQDTDRRRDQIITQVRKLRVDGKYSDALSEIDHVPDELRSDTMLLRLKRELERDAENSRLAAWIAETVDHVLKEALTSLDAGLSTLREAMQKLPGEDRFESLEADLLRRKQEFSSQQRRASCLREAGEMIHAGEPERAIRLIEYYLLEFQTDAEIDGLLQEARQSVEAQRLRVRLAEYNAQGRALVDESKFTQAIAFLRPLVEETQNRGLATLLGQAEQGKVEADGRIRLVAKRVAELRQEGKLEEAIKLIESQPKGMLASSLLQEVLLKLHGEHERALEEQRQQQEERRRAAEKQQEERRKTEEKQQAEQRRAEEKQREEAARKQALDTASAKVRGLIERGDWQNAREPLENLKRVYGDSDSVGRAMAEFDRERLVAADRQVARSIETAKAALLEENRDAARRALDEGASLVSFASAGLAEEWKRLSRLPKEKEKTKPSLVAIDLAEPEAKTKSKMLPIAAAAVVLLAVGGGFLFLQKKPAEVARNDTPVQVPGPTTTPSSPDKNQTPAAGPTRPINPQPTDQPSGKSSVVEKPSNPIDAKSASPKGAGSVDHGPPKPVDPRPLPPAVVAQPKVNQFQPDQLSIERGASTILRWNVENVQSVTIDGVGSGLGKQGFARISPDKNTQYVLSGDGKQLERIEVAVTSPSPSPPPPPKTAETSRPNVSPVPAQVVASAPSKDDLNKALRAFQGVFGRASTGKAKECKTALAGLSQYGSTKPSNDLQNWCEASAKFQANQKCDGSPSGNDKEAIWACAEVITISPKDSPVASATYRGDAHFTKAGDNWQVTKWDLHP